MRFEHETLPQRVCFAPGEAPATVRSEVERLGTSRVMVIASPAEADLAEKVIADLPVVLRHDEVVMHVPAASAERARATAAAHEVDLVVCVGEGSTTGLAKAIALTSGIPIVAVPTMYAGSEATSVWGLTEGARKTTGVDTRVLPRSIVYDATLTLSLPVSMSVASGLNALAHCVDSMWAPHTDSVGVRAPRPPVRWSAAEPVTGTGRRPARAPGPRMASVTGTGPVGDSPRRRREPRCRNLDRSVAPCPQDRSERDAGKGRDGSDERCEDGVSRQVDAVTTRVFDLLGKRWSGPLIGVLLSGPAHFTELHLAVPCISGRILSDRLAHLAAAGLVVREVRTGQ